MRDILVFRPSDCKKLWVLRAHEYTALAPAWRCVQTSTIVSGFQKCGITESNDSSSSEEEGDNIDDRYQDIIGMLAESDSDTSFNGFEEHSDVDNTGNDD